MTKMTTQIHGRDLQGHFDTVFMTKEQKGHFKKNFIIRANFSTCCKLSFSINSIAKLQLVHIVMLKKLSHKLAANAEP